jgi:hypothetical protein
MIRWMFQFAIVVDSADTILKDGDPRVSCPAGENESPVLAE